MYSLIINGKKLHMKMSLFSLLFLITAQTCLSQVPFSDSFAARFFTEDEYGLIEKGIQHWAHNPEEAPGREASAARGFIQQLRHSDRPDLTGYAEDNSESNPIAALWAQFFLRQQGHLKELKPPPYYRHIFALAFTLDPYLENAADHEGVSRMVLDIVRDLKEKHFLQHYYDINENDFSIFWSTARPSGRA